jgi:peptidoglycan DL-endopeptidase CwlO
LWSGLTGKSWSQILRLVISGQNPATAQTTQATVGAPNLVGGTGSTSATGEAAGQVIGTAFGSQIANDALQYTGHSYVYGGAPGPNGTNGWDCSSFVNWVLSHDMHMAIPGGTWNPSTHGPTTLSYLAWSGAQTISRSGVEAGDLCNWQTHIGIAINNSQMISALNPSMGTEVTGIEAGGPSGEALVCRRLRQLCQ